MDQALSLRKKRGEYSFAGAVLLSLFLSVLLLLFLLLVASFLSLRVQDPASLIPALGNGAALLCAFLCGFFAARLRGRQGVLIGATAGLGYLLFFLLGLAILAGDGVLHMGMILFSYLIFLSLSTLGGLLGTKKPKPRRHARRVHR